MEGRKNPPAWQEGKFLNRQDRVQLHRQNRRRILRRRWVTVVVLLSWDGLLLYMILHCLIDPVYGAVLVAGVSVCLGYQF